ncbi:MAG: branched-chain amino acid ABC transporter ATP-binding protein [Proteobacteria bacterium]|nr:MAG: branched-chain amino acid ABC transporter ATP-binding protein [Pseudomonadota bacterium]
MTTDSLTISNLTAGYGDVTVLWDIDLAVPASGITALIGSNGAGKTTLMRVISGIVTARSGAMTWEGRSIFNQDPSAVLRAGIAHVPEGRRLFGPMTVEENLLMGGYARDCSNADLHRDLEWVYEVFPKLRERRTQAAGTMSGGEQQMCAIGRGLMSKPKLLMIDELSLGLSPVMVDQLVADLKALSGEGLAIFLVEQDVATALELAEVAFVMDRGRIVRHGSAAELAADPAVQEAYIGSMG